jgi:hypothetical protein
MPKQALQRKHWLGRQRWGSLGSGDVVVDRVRNGDRGGEGWAAGEVEALGDESLVVQ